MFFDLTMRYNNDAKVIFGYILKEENTCPRKRYLA